MSASSANTDERRLTSDELTRDSTPDNHRRYSTPGRSSSPSTHRAPAPASPLQLALRANNHTRLLRQLKDLSLDVNWCDVDGETVLLEACRNGDSKACGLLLQHHADPNMKNVYGETALHEVCKSGDSEMCQTLLQHKANPNIITDNSGESALHKACYDGYIELCRLLVTANGQLNAVDIHGYSLLHSACRNANMEVVQWLVNEIDANVNARDRKKKPMHPAGRTPLQLAVQKKHATVAQWLVENECTDLEILNEDFILHMSIEAGIQDFALWLISRYPALKSTPYMGLKPILFACKAGQLKIFQELECSSTHMQETEAGDTLLHIASQCGHLDLASWLLSKTEQKAIALSKQNNRGETPLHLATKSAHQGIMELLVQNGNTLDAIDKDGCTVMHVAAQTKESCQQAKWLVQKGASMMVEDRDGYRPLHYACKTGKLEFVSWLFDTGGSCANLLNDQNKLGRTPLHLAIRFGHIDLAHTLVGHKADLEIADKHRCTALHSAIENKYEDFAMWLLDTGADKNAKTTPGHTPLRLSIDKDLRKLTQSLLDHKADTQPTEKLGDTPLHWASRAGQMELVERLVEHCEMQVATADKDSQTPLHCAVEGGHLAVAKWLIDHRADVNAQAADGFTALHLACEQGDLDMASLLVTKGADMKEESFADGAPLRLASNNGHHQLVEFLEGLDANASCQLREVLFEAIKKNQFSTVQWLVLEKNVDVDICMGTTGTTPLHHAVYHNRLEMAEWLVDNGANCSIADHSGSTPLLLAIDQQWFKIAKWLLCEVNTSELNPKGDFDKQIAHQHLWYEVGEQLVTDKSKWCEEAAFIAEKIIRMLQTAGNTAGEDAKQLLKKAVAAGDHWEEWANSVNAYLRRYSGKKAKYKSSTSTVHKAWDCKSEKWVALKVVHGQEGFHREIRMRQGLDLDAVFEVVRVHVPVVHRDEFSHHFAEHIKDHPDLLADEPTDSEYVIVMDWASTTLSDELRMNQVAGIDVQSVRLIAHDVACALNMIHKKNRIHGDLKPRNICRRGASPNTSQLHQNTNQWALIDFERGADKSHDMDVMISVRNCSEAYRPPECMDTQIDQIKASALLDIWSYGVLLWELMSGIDLFQKDLNNDAMVSAEDRSKLACWSDLSHHQLDLVFKPASEQRLITALRRLMAQDLVSLCLCGTSGTFGAGHPCPQDRPSSMAAILEHPFFLPDEALERRFALPTFRPQMVRTHVMLSYQSTQVMHLKRLARLLNAMHISTKDGTMVPPGFHWKQWFFKELEESLVFTPILSAEFCKSDACFDEANRAQELHKPVLAVVHDWEGWKAELAKSSPREWSNLSIGRAEHLAEQRACAVALPTESNSFDSCNYDFWQNFIELVCKLEPHLSTGSEGTVHVAICCTTSNEDTKFAEQLLNVLRDDCNIDSIVCKSRKQFEEVWPPTCDHRVVALFVLTECLHQDKHMKDMVLAAHCRKASIVPIRKELPLCDATQKQDQFICSILSRANRIPANEDFAPLHGPQEVGVATVRNRHMQELATAIESHLSSDRTEHTLMLNRIPMYRSAMHRLVVQPSPGSSFVAELHLKDLFNTLLVRSMSTGHNDVVEQRSLSIRSVGRSLSIGHDDSQGALGESLAAETQITATSPSKVLLCHAANDQEAAAKIAVLLQQKFEVLQIIGVDWYEECSSLQHGRDTCLVLLSEEFLNCNECEGRFNFAIDKRATVVGLRIDTRFEQLMQAPVTLSKRELINKLEGGDASMMSTMEAARAAHSACVRRHCAQCKEDVDRVTTHLIDLQNVLEVELTSKVDALQAEKAKMPMGGVAAADLVIRDTLQRWLGQTPRLESYTSILLANAYDTVQMLSQLNDVDELIDMGFLKNHASVIIKCAKNTEEIQQSEHVDAQDSATETVK